MGISGKIRVLEVLRLGDFEGGESHILGLVERMDKLQFDPVVLSFTEGGIVDKLQQNGVSCSIIRSKKPFDVKIWHNVKGLLQREKIDVIHVHSTRAASNLLWAARSLRIPMVYTINGWSFHEDQSAIVRRIRILAEKYITKRMDANISISLSNQTSGERYFNINNSVIINKGVDRRKFNPGRKDYADLRQKLRIPPESTLVGYVAEITEQKDPLTMIRAFREVVNEEKNVYLLVIGEGKLKYQAIILTHQLSLQDRIFFEPALEDVPSVLNAMDIYCLPSLWEDFPLGLLEAMSMGKAVIATNVGGSGEIIKHGENGILVEPMHPDQLANAILLLHYNRKLRLEIQERGVRMIEEKFNAASITKKIESIYRRVLYQNKIFNYEYN